VPTGVRLLVVQLEAVLDDVNAGLVCQKLNVTADAQEMFAAAVVRHVPSGVAATAFAAKRVDEVNVQDVDTEESAADEFPVPAVALFYDADLAE
jgi:multisubunit Na+/H+ antiporter MnhE subunit